MINRIVSIGLIALVGVLGLQSCGSESSSDVRLNAEEFQQKLDAEGGIVIDVRTQEEFDAGHLARADYQYDYLSGEFEAQLDSLDKDKTYYLYCRSGNRSGKSQKLMKEHGFTNVYNVGGYQQLVEGGFESKQ